MKAPTPRVLVVDDERFFREAIRDALSAGGIECQPVANGEEALKAVEDPRIGAVVLDVRLPDLSGVEVLQRILTLRPALRVVMLSAHTEQEMVLDALRMGACDYLAKPLHDEELRLAVQRALQAHGTEVRWQSLRGRLHLLGARLTELLDAARELPAGSRAALLGERIAESVAEVLAARRASLLELDPDDGLLRPRGIIGPELLPDELEPTAVGESIAGLVFDHGHAVLIDDLDRDERCVGRLRRGGFRSGSVALAPLFGPAGGTAVVCATDPEHGRVFEDEDLALLRLLALQLGPLLFPEVAEGPRAAGAEPPFESTQPIAEGGAAVHDADLMREICSAITDEVEPGRLFDAALRAIEQALPAAPVSLHLLDARSGELTLEAQREGAGAGDRTRLSRDRGLTGTALQTGQIVVADEPDSDPRFDAEIDTPASGASGPLLCLPLRVRGKVLGVARIFPAKGASATVRHGEILCGALSAAVRNVLLYRSLLESIDDLARARRESEDLAER